MRLFIAFFILTPMLYVHDAFARPPVIGTVVTDVGDVGEHYPLFRVEKSHNPENITVVYTKLDTNCDVIPDREHDAMPTLDFYWLMDGKSYKPMAGSLKAGARKRLQFTDAPGGQDDPTSFAVHIDDLSRMQHDLPSPTMQVKTARRGEACVAAAYMTLGPSDGNATVQVESVYTETEDITMLKKMQAMGDPDAVRIDAVTVKGTNVATGQPIERTYRAAN